VVHPESKPTHYYPTHKIRKGNYYTRYADVNIGTQETQEHSVLTIDPKEKEIYEIPYKKCKVIIWFNDIQHSTSNSVKSGKNS
jgi:hypothetical protein